MNDLFLTLARLRRSVPFSLRLQLAVWYTLAFAVLLLLTGAVFYQYLETRLEASVDTDLGLRAQQVASALVVQKGTVTLDRGSAEVFGLGQTQAGPGIPLADVNQGALVRLLDAHGRLLGETPAFRELLVPQSSVTQPLAGTPWQGTVLSLSDQEVRLYSRTLVSAGKPVAVIQVGESLAHLHTLLHDLVAALLVVGFLVLVCCGILSYWLSGRSFAPMKRLAETARKIQAGDLHQRVPVPPVRDEMQYLALTLNAMLDSLEASFSRQRRFVADASHELRTPVAVIRNKAEVALLRSRSPHEYCSALQSIHAEAERLSHLISDLLALARGDEGQARFEYEAVRLDALVEAVIANAQGLAQEHGVSLIAYTPQSVTLLGDEARLIQVILNLVDNAIRYTNPGGQVQVNLGATAEAAHLVVQDTGIGIAPEHLPHIFERFYRADPSRQRTRGSGTGLGLSIVEWIVRKHGGSVVVNSQVGQGSCFTVQLPLRPLTPEVPAPGTLLGMGKG
ncbi:MAG TPA: ATP-binding protein [Ktedonobacteraceae bacterium]|jgi:heavy metal sensor kinase|nr:ATP-binding protein [Ktedonobacteraceae bacterium]